MATTVPEFRSINKMLGEMTSTFLSELDRLGITPGLQSLKPGSPYLAIFEAVALSQFRQQNQTLMLLDANDVDLAVGSRLDQLGTQEKLPRLSATFASGLVNFSDTSFTKIYSKIYQGKPAPIPGSSVIYVSDATSFTATGNIYLGRGTVNLEGPLPYASVVNAGSYWTITLTAPTTKPHGLGETVTLAQGGNRAISVGQVVETPQGNSGTAAAFTTTMVATILDGETSITGIPVTSRSPGVVGNVSAGGIKTIPTPAFSGMAVTNPLAFTNGLDIETDDLYRDRIRSARRARTGVGTPLGLSTYVYGTTAPDESATAISAQYVNRTLLPSLLVVDDGTGYEAKSDGTAFETLIESAAGGEDTFFLSRIPVAKASLTTIQAAPYILSDQSSLTVVVGGITFSHTFSATEFNAINNASAYEVVASINSDPNIPFSAYTVGAGSQVAIFAKSNSNDDIEVIATTSVVDANDALVFPSGKASTLRLYKNDVLLSKDGAPASLTAADQSSWSAMVSGETLIIGVDGTPNQTYTIIDADFIALGLGYTNVAATLPLAAWAEVFNAKVSGITCTISGGSLVFTSNRGSSSRASLEIDPSSTLVVKGLFNPLALSAQGRALDYVLDRNRGQIDLVEPLDPADTLTAGTTYTRAYIQSAALGATVTVAVGGANLWVVVDGNTEIIHHELNAANRIYQDWTATNRTFTAFIGAGLSAAYPFLDIQVGDFAIWSEDAWTGFGGAPATYNTMRVSEVDSAGQWFRCDYPTTGGGTAASYNDPALPVFQRLSLVRASAIPQRVNIPAATYTPAQLQAAITMSGAAPSIVTNHLRLTTNTYDIDGDVSLVAQDTNALVIGLSVDVVNNDESERAAVQSGNSEIGTVDPVNLLAITSLTGTAVGSDLADNANNGAIIGGYWLRAPTTTLNDYFGTNTEDLAEWSGVTGVPEVTLDSVMAPPRPGIDLLASVSRYRVGPLGTLNTVFDNDPVTKGYTVPMTRWTKPDAAVPYGATIRLKDADNLSGGLPQSLALAFGTSFDFSNFCLHAHSRARIDLSSTQPGNTDTLLLRLKSWNGRDDTAFAHIKAPLASEADLSVVNTAPLGHVGVYVPSGTARAITVNASDHIMASQAAPATTITVNSGFRVTSIARVGATVTVIVTRPTADTASTYFAPAQTAYVYVDDADYPAGVKTIASVATTVFTNDTFTYTEAGANTVILAPDSLVSRAETPAIDFTNAQVGDYLCVNVGTWSGVDNLGATKLRYRITARDPLAPSYWVRVAADTVTGGWATIANPTTDFEIFPLASNTTSAVVSAINALSTSSISATLAGGPGTGVIAYVEASMLRVKLADGTLHIASSAYDATPGIENYNLTLKVNPDATLTTTPNDWANEEFRLAPTTAKNVSDYMNRGSVTGLDSAGVSVQASSSGHKIQLASGTLGSEGAVQVSGGTANNLYTSVLSAVVSGSNIVVSTSTTEALEAVSNRSYVELNSSIVAPKVRDWTSATTLTAAAGVTTVAGAGTAWTYAPIDPTFGTRWSFSKVGKYAIATPSVNAVVPSMAGKWVKFAPGYGKWCSGTFANTGLIGRAYATLADGRVLAYGGVDSYDLTTCTTSTVVEAFDPATGLWWPMTALPFARAFGTATALANNTVLYAGGVSSGALTWHNDAYIFDPSAGPIGGDGRPQGAWAVSASTMTVARAHHTATLMSTGVVVIAGGSTALGTTTATTDVYTPGTDLFTPNPDNLSKSRAGHIALPFSLDQILVVGGEGAAGAGYEIFTLSTQQWTNDQPLGFGETRVGHCVVPLTASTFLVIGGAGAQATIDPNMWTNIRTSCEIYDAVTNTITAVGSVKIPRIIGGAALLPGGKVIVYGGLAAMPAIVPPITVDPQRSTEIFDITTQTWTFGSGSIYTHLFCPPVHINGSQLTIADCIDGVVVMPYVETFDSSLVSAPAGNNGIFRVLNSSTDHLMFEAPTAEDGECEFGYTAFYTYDSVMPGDTLRIASSTLGTAPQGNYVISDVDLFNTHIFTIPVSVSFATGALGAGLSLTGIIAKDPAKMLYTVQAILPDDLHTDQSLISLIPNVNVDHFSADHGATLTFEDKLEFPTNLTPGSDGYRYHTGLLAEVNKVVYGDSKDTVTYPGYASAGAAIDVSAPLIRRVIISLAIRTMSGAVDVKTRVQGAVAKTINSAPPGPIAISKIIETVQAVEGVISVVMLSPLPTTSADSISVAMHEKALILDPINDVQVSMMG